MREFAKGFYKSQAWKKCREAYAKSRGYLCEKCLARGQYKSGEIVHHKIHVEPETIHDPMVLLNWDNLELLCRDCHAKEHESKTKKRYKIGADGRVTIKPGAV